MKYKVIAICLANNNNSYELAHFSSESDANVFWSAKTGLQSHESSLSWQFIVRPINYKIKYKGSIQLGESVVEIEYTKVDEQIIEFTHRTINYTTSIYSLIN